MLTSENIGQLNVTPCALDSRRISIEMLNAVLGEDTGELMEYRHLIQNLKYQQLWITLYVNELGILAQGIPGRLDVTNAIFFLNN